MKESAHCCALCISFDIETFLETINTTASIYQLLLAGIEGMALGADIHFHFFLSGTRLKSFTAYAANHTLAVLGMDVFLHCCFTSFAYAMASNANSILTYRKGICNIFFAFFFYLLYNCIRIRRLFSAFPCLIYYISFRRN